jgi:hypothetical protein
MARAKSIAKSPVKPAGPVRSPGKASSKGTAAPGLAAMRPDLHIIAVELRCALSAVTVAARALREQNADMDSDIAAVLQRAAGGPLHAGLEKIESLLEVRNRPTGRDATGASERVH